MLRGLSKADNNLLDAVLGGRSDLVKFYLHSKVGNANMRMPCACHGILSRTARCINRAISISAGDSILSVAARTQNIEITKMLVLAGARVDALSVLAMIGSGSSIMEEEALIFLLERWPEDSDYKKEVEDIANTVKALREHRGIECFKWELNKGFLRLLHLGHGRQSYE